MPQNITLSASIPLALAGMRVDQALAQIFPEHSRARLSRWLKEHQVAVDGKFLRPKDKVQGGEQIKIVATLVDHQQWQAQPIALEIIYEDDSLLVINKPGGLVVHPAAGNLENTLVNALLYHCPELASIPRAGLIHRLDKDTTGLLVVAKSLIAHTALVTAMQQRQITREYQAVVYGQIIAHGTVNTAMGRHPRNRLKMAVVTTGKSAITHYRVVKRYADFTQLQITLETGRTHQIRVHLSHILHPLIGEQLYVGRLPSLKHLTSDLSIFLSHFNRQALHAFRLSFTHPIQHNPLQFTAPLPQDMQQLLELLDNNHAT